MNAIAHGAAQRKATQLNNSTLTFGIEIETVGLGIRGCVQAVHSVVGGNATHDRSYNFVGRGSYVAAGVEMADGRKWSVVYDGSLSHNGAEVVSPICTLEDLDTVQAIVRALKAAGAKVDETCGIHIHVGIKHLEAKQIRNLMRLVFRYDHIIAKGLQVKESRRGSECRGYARPLSTDVMERVDALGNDLSISDLNKAWYGSSREFDARSQKYHDSRYNGLNLHAFWYQGTAEFRWFNGTLHAGKIRSYIMFCLSLVSRAQIMSGNSKCKRYTVQDAEVKGWSLMSALLVRLGMKDDNTAALWMREGLATKSQIDKLRKKINADADQAEAPALAPIPEPAPEPPAPVVDYFNSRECPF